MTTVDNTLLDAVFLLHILLVAQICEAHHFSAVWTATSSEKFWEHSPTNAAYLTPAFSPEPLDGANETIFKHFTLESCWRNFHILWMFWADSAFTPIFVNSSEPKGFALTLTHACM